MIICSLSLDFDYFRRKINFIAECGTHAYNPSKGQGRKIVSSRPTWVTQWVEGQHTKQTKRIKITFKEYENNFNFLNIAFTLIYIFGQNIFQFIHLYFKSLFYLGSPSYDLPAKFRYCSFLVWFLLYETFRMSKPTVTGSKLAAARAKEKREGRVTA
jgi:hypothetical protein